MQKFQIFTDSCSDLPTEVRKEYGLEYLYMGLVVDGKEMHADLDWKEYGFEEFYNWMVEGKSLKTTQVPILEFVNRFTPYLEKGIDILYLGCSSKLTASLNACHLAAEELKEQFPDRKIIGIDTMLASCVEGWITLDAAKLQASGKSLEEVAAWVEENKKYYNQFATTETLTYLKKAGRISGSKAFMGNLFHKKPIFISDKYGSNYTIDLVTGLKNADESLIQGMKDTYDKEKSGGTIIIGQGVCMDRALRLKKRIEDEIGAKVEIWPIGPIVGTTCGPGIIATFCVGKEVTRYDGEPKQ